MEATTALKESSKSMPVSSIAKVSSATVMKYTKMKASTALPTPSGIGRPPMRSGATAAGWIRSFISRPAWRASSSVRNILMPPPVLPVGRERQPAQRDDVAPEVERRDHHERHQHQLDRGGIEIGDAAVVGGEA